MFGAFTKLWDTNRSASNDSPTSHPNMSAIIDETMGSDGSEDVLMGSESVHVARECTKSQPRASDAQFISRDAFEVYKQKQANDYSRLNDKNFRLQKLDQASREKIQGLLKEVRSKTQEAQEAQMELFDTQLELNTCKEEQKKMEANRQRDQAEMKTDLRKWRQTIAHFHDIGKDLQSEQKAHRATQRELEAYKVKQGHTQINGTELQGLREKLAASQQDLSACKDDLFRLQPIAQTPDSDISKSFDFICQQIVDWIDEELLGFEQANLHLSQKDFFLVGGDIKIVGHLQKNIELGEYLSRYMIHCYLEAKLLGPSCPLLGLARGDQELLQRTERSMGKLHPPRDSTTISAWRSETFKAIARTEESQKLREQQIQAMTLDMFESLSETFPIVFGNSEAMNRFRVQVMEPASKLATTLRGSCSTYLFQIAKSPFPKFNSLTMNLIRNNCMIDAKTRMTLKPNTGMVADKHGVLGKCIIMLEPELYRVNEDKEDSKLRRGTYLVGLDHPIAKSN